MKKPLPHHPVSNALTDSENSPLKLHFEQLGMEPLELDRKAIVIAFTIETLDELRRRGYAETDLRLTDKCRAALAHYRSRGLEPTQDELNETALEMMNAGMVSLRVP